MAHAQTLPFTVDELTRVFRLLTGSEVEARAMAQDALSPGPGSDVHSLPPVPREGPRSGLEFTPLPHVSLTDDTLVLLSLLSEDLRVRVERYRTERRNGAPPTPAEQSAWERRRGELKHLIEERAGGDRPE